MIKLLFIVVLLVVIFAAYRGYRATSRRRT
jgi:hypothetical protein